MKKPTTKNDTPTFIVASQWKVMHAYVHVKCNLAFQTNEPRKEGHNCIRLQILLNGSKMVTEKKT